VALGGRKESNLNGILFGLLLFIQPGIMPLCCNIIGGETKVHPCHSFLKDTWGAHLDKEWKGTQKNLRSGQRPIPSTSNGQVHKCTSWARERVNQMNALPTERRRPVLPCVDPYFLAEA